MTISVTESAVKHISDQLKTRGQGLGIRVGVKTTGCSGMAYVLEFVDELEKGDAVFEDHGVKIVVKVLAFRTLLEPTIISDSCLTASLSQQLLCS